MEQATVTDVSQEDVSVHGFWKWVTSSLFDMQNLTDKRDPTCGRRLRRPLTTVKKEKKYR